MSSGREMRHGTACGPCSMLKLLVIHRDNEGDGCTLHFGRADSSVRYNDAIRLSLRVVLVAAALWPWAARAEPIRIRREVVREITAGASLTITWTVIGTTEPVRLRLWNSDPTVATVAGGDVQFVTTSGGTPNSVSRAITTLRPGQFDVKAEIVDGPSSPKDDARAATIATAFRRELTRIAAELRAA